MPQPRQSLLPSRYDWDDISEPEQPEFVVFDHDEALHIARFTTLAETLAFIRKAELENEHTVLCERLIQVNTELKGIYESPKSEAITFEAFCDWVKAAVGALPTDPASRRAWVSAYLKSYPAALWSDYISLCEHGNCLADKRHLPLETDPRFNSKFDQ